MEPRPTNGLLVEFVPVSEASPFPAGVPLFLGVLPKDIPPKDVPQEKPADAGGTGPICLIGGLSEIGAFPRPPRSGKAETEPLQEGGRMAAVVRGYFQNGGRVCGVAPLDPQLEEPKLRATLNELLEDDRFDLVCAPDLFPVKDPDDREWTRVYSRQKVLLECCADRGDRFVILDGPPGKCPDAVRHQRLVLETADPRNGVGALYYPWVGGASGGRGLSVPPCGHVAGIYARSHRAAGPHKPPANELVVGVSVLAHDLSAAERDELFEAGINSLVGGWGRGVRVWGARALSTDSPWDQVNIRRLFQTVFRWVRWTLTAVAWEPLSMELLVRIRREVGAYCLDLWRAGALRGGSPEEAFYVHCQTGTGHVVTEIGLAPARPCEFIALRVIHRPDEPLLRSSS